MDGDDRYDTPAGIVVGDIRGCGDDQDPVVITGPGGEPFRVTGLRPAWSVGGKVQIIVEAVA